METLKAPFDLKRLCRSILIMLLPFIPQTSGAQYYDFFQQEYFFGNLPSARTEAMGRADVALGGSPNTCFFNPAGLANMGRRELSLSHSTPYYSLTNSKYFYAGYGHRVNRKAVVGLSVNQFAVGETNFTVKIQGVNYAINKPTSTNFAFSATYHVFYGLHLGINSNLFRWRLFDELSAFSTVHIDAGLLYIQPDSTGTRKRRWQLGASMSNLSASTITYESPDGRSSTSPFPVIGRVACAYLTKGDPVFPIVGSMPVQSTVTAQFQTLFNNDFRQGFNLGWESVINHTLAVRIGYLSHSLNTSGLTINRDKLQDITFGFGFMVPFAELTQHAFPYNVNMDYVSLRPPSYVTSGKRLSNMHTVSLRFSQSHSR